MNFDHFSPFFSALEILLRQQKTAIVAIEGGSASGKTTLATFLKQQYECNIFHMDDFFLQPHQRHPERYSQPYGNIDYERFLEEVLVPLSAGQSVQYRRFNCHTLSLEPPVEISFCPLNFIEGTYSMHPLFAPHYDLSVFLNISPEFQRQRIHARNTPDSAQRFFSTWIPMEQRSFSTVNTMTRCNLIIDILRNDSLPLSHSNS